MTREEVAEWLKFMQEEEHNKADSIVPCTNEIALGIAIEALRQPQIVMCKDCKYAILTYSGECKYCKKRIDDDGGMDQLYLPGDWFCADGERKEGDGE